jgi:hypothetical protein
MYHNQPLNHNRMLALPRFHTHKVTVPKPTLP